MLRLVWALALAAIFAITPGLSAPACAEELLPVGLQGVELDQRLGEIAGLDARFTDHTGKQVTIGELMADGKPTILTLNYYRCETLCNFQLNAMLAGLKTLNWTPGEQFRIITVSIDEREGWERAAGKRSSYLADYGRGEVDWSFLVGDRAQIDALADSVGFRYRYIEDEDQYAHPAAAIFLAPDGTITRYLVGLTYEGRDIRFALMEAADGKVGNPVEQFVFSCYRFDYVGGKYTPTVMGLMRTAGSMTVIALVLLVIYLFRQEKSRHQLLESTP
jgi:protein SCO1/2